MIKTWLGTTALVFSVVIAFLVFNQSKPFFPSKQPPAPHFYKIIAWTLTEIDIF